MWSTPLFEIYFYIEILSLRFSRTFPSTDSLVLYVRGRTFVRSPFDTHDSTTAFLFPAADNLGQISTTVGWLCQT